MKSIGLAIALILGSAAPAFSCTCLPLPADSLPQMEGTTVFLGRVLKVTAKVPKNYKLSSPERPYYLVRLKVERPWSGTRRGKVLTIKTAWDGACGVGFSYSKHWLVFATKDETGHLWAGLCGGTIGADTKNGELPPLTRSRIAALDRWRSMQEETSQP